MTSSSSVPSAAPAEARCWAGLPVDVLCSVFTRTGQADVLQAAGVVCASWWRSARHEPALWRHIDLTVLDNDDDQDDDEESSDDDCSKFSLFDDDTLRYTTYVANKAPQQKDARDQGMMGRWKAFALAAVDRSAGQCEAFKGRADDEVLLYLADRAPSLKSLSVTSHYDVSSEAFSHLIVKFPLLDELELVLKSDKDGYLKKDNEQPGTNTWVALLQSASKACCHLRRFTVRHAGRRPHSYYQKDPKPPKKPFSMQTMRDLTSLELFGDSFTKHVVLHIVENCPNLESLHVKDVPYLTLYVDEIRNKCSRVKDLILPYDSDSEDGGCICCFFG